MLVQTFRRTVPDHDAFIERTLLRDPGFCVAFVRTKRLALDRGVLARAVTFPTRFRRPQLTIVLAGRGYLQASGRLLTLGAGDVVESDQRTHAAEGYGGAAAEVMLVDWSPDGPFAAAPAAAPRVSRIGPSDVAALRALAADRHTLPPARFVAALGQRLRALGLPLAPTREADVAPSPPHLVRLYAAIGDALSRLDAHPQLLDLAEATHASERQIHRRLAELARDYGHAFEGWRDLLHEMRLDWAAQLLCLPDLPLSAVARIAGYRSAIALHHAFSLRGARTPRAIAQDLAERWR